jgi:hypothetical protein
MERGDLRPAQLRPQVLRPAHLNSTAGEPEIYDLLRRHQHGLLHPLPAGLGSLPANATESLRLVAEDMALLIGLRLAVDEDRPLLYSASFCAWRMGWALPDGQPDKKRAARVIRRLVDAGVIAWVGVMPRSGTYTYAPPSQAVAPGPDPETPAVCLEPTIQPVDEVSQQAVVQQAQPVLGEDLGVIAARNRATTRSHRTQPNA